MDKASRAKWPASELPDARVKVKQSIACCSQTKRGLSVCVQNVWKNQTGKMKGQYALTLQLLSKKSWNMEMLPEHGLWRIIEN